MESMENFEELRRNMNKILENRRGLPEEVIRRIKEMFDRLEEKYREMGCFSGTIQQYMQGNLDELILRLQKGIGTGRKEQQFEDVQAFLSGVERDIEQKLDSEEQKQKDAERREQIQEIGNDKPNNIRVTLNSMDEIVLALQDVQSRQRRLLASRGTSDRQVYEVDDEVQYFIRQLRSRDEEGIHAAFQQDSAELDYELLQAYEYYVEQRETAEKPKQDIFRESLSAGISLEQQRDNTKGFVDNLQKEESTGQKLVESLPDLFL